MCGLGFVQCCWYLVYDSYNWHMLGIVIIDRHAVLCYLPICIVSVFMFLICSVCFNDLCI